MPGAHGQLLECRPGARSLHLLGVARILTLGELTVAAIPEHHPVALVIVRNDTLGVTRPRLPALCGLGLEGVDLALGQLVDIGLGGVAMRADIIT